MANSFTLLVSYIENLLWLCTQLFYGILFIIDFNYQLVTGLFKGLVQLWGLLVQTGINAANALVFSIEFLAELPVRSFHLGIYLFEQALNLMNNACEACMSWFWASLAYSGQMLIALSKNVGMACIGGLTQLFDLLVFQCTQLFHLFTSLTGATYSHVKEAKENTVLVIQTVGNDAQESVQGVCSLIYEYFIAGVTYPISFLDACTKSMINGLHLCISSLHAVLDLFMRIFEDMIKIFNFGLNIIANGLNDIVNTLNEIATFFIKMIDYVSQTLIACFNSAVDGYSSLSLFIEKNWGALLALALCVVLVWVTINMTGQHERNIQRIVQDLTRLVNSFSHSRPRDINREPLRPEGHQDIHLEDQEQGRLQGQNENNEENRNEDAGQDLPVGAVGGEGDQPGPSRPRPTHHTPYSFRSRPFTPSGDFAEGNSSVESIMSDLRNRLSEEQDRQVCVVCLDAVKNTLFMPCRHLCVCLPCADTIVSNEDIYLRICPLCRSRIGSIVEVYS